MTIASGAPAGAKTDRSSLRGKTGDGEFHGDEPGRRATIGAEMYLQAGSIPLHRMEA